MWRSAKRCRWSLLCFCILVSLTAIVLHSKHLYTHPRHQSRDNNAISSRMRIVHDSKTGNTNSNTGHSRVGVSRVSGHGSAPPHPRSASDRRSGVIDGLWTEDSAHRRSAPHPSALTPFAFLSLSRRGTPLHQCAPPPAEPRASRSQRSQLKVSLRYVIQLYRHRYHMEYQHATVGMDT